MIKNKLINFFKSNWHVLLLISISLIPLFWFLGRGGAIINGVDTNFPLNPTLWIIRRFYMWNNVSNGGSDFSFAPAGIFFHLIQLIPYLVGLTLQTVEKISLVFWFGLIILNSYLFSGNFIKQDKLLRILFVSLYGLNIYMFNSWENVKVSNLSLVAGIPLLLHVFINLNEGRINYLKAGLLLIVVSLVLSGAGINPAYFIAAILSLLVYVVVLLFSGENFKNLIKNFLFVVGIICLVGSYWIIPTVGFVLRNVSQNASIGSIGFNNWIDSLSENTSIINILRLQGAWDWYSFDGVSKAPLFLPYTPNYFYKLSFILFSFVIPAISLISLAFVNKNKIKYYLSFLIMLLIGVFLGSGSHEPTGSVFKWLATYIPYFSLFRSPWYIFTPILTISLAGLTVLFFDKFSFSKITKYFALLLIVANIIYCYPLITGRIFRPTKPDGFFVNFPKYVFDAGTELSKNVVNRTITYPDDQLEKFNWGYIGVDPVVNLFINNEMVFPAINNTKSTFSLITNEFYEKIKINNTIAAENILAKLNVYTLLEKTDQQTLAPKLNKNNGWGVSQFENWKVYTVNENYKKDEKIVLANNFYYGSFNNQKDSASQLGLLKPQMHLINYDDSVVEKISYYLNNSGRVIASSNSHRNNYEQSKIQGIDFSSVDYDFEIPEDGFYAPIVERYGLDEKALNNFTLINGDSKLSLSLSKVDDSHVYFDSVFLRKGKYTYSHQIINQKVFRENFDSIGGQLDLINTSEKDLNYEIKIPNFNYNKKYFISFDYNWNKGNKPLVLIEQRNNDILFKTDAIGLEGEVAFSTYKRYYSPVQTESDVILTLVSPKTKSDRGTLVSYDNLYVTELFTNKLYFVKDSKIVGNLANIEYTKNSPVKYVGVVKDVENPQTIIFKDNYSDDWKIKITDLDGRKIKYRAEHFTIDVYANAWYVDTINKDYRFEIYYDPQKYFNWGVIISASVVLVIVVMYSVFRKRYEK